MQVKEGTQIIHKLISSDGGRPDLFQNFSKKLNEYLQRPEVDEFEVNYHHTQSYYNAQVITRESLPG